MRLWGALSRPALILIDELQRAVPSNRRRLRCVSTRGHLGMAGVGGTLAIVGASGKKLIFDIYPNGTAFNAIGLVFAVTRAMPDGVGGYEHTILYIGQTDDLCRWLNDRRQTERLERWGSNRICIHPDDEEESRLAKERDLIARWAPPGNC